MIPVMIVDDEYLIRVGMRSMLEWEKYGYTVVAEAEDGQSALRLFREKRPYLVFCDIQMPDMSGLELMEELRRQDASVQFVVLTAHREFEYAQHAIRLGVAEYIVKATMLEEEIVAILQRIHPLLFSRPGREERARDVIEDEGGFLEATLESEGALAQLLHLDDAPDALYHCLYLLPAGEGSWLRSVMMRRTFQSMVAEALREAKAGECCILSGTGALAVFCPALPAEGLRRAAQQMRLAAGRYLEEEVWVGISAEAMPAPRLEGALGQARLAGQQVRLQPQAPVRFFAGPGPDVRDTVLGEVALIRGYLAGLQYDRARAAIRHLFCTTVAGAGNLDCFRLAALRLITQMGEFMVLDESGEWDRIAGCAGLDGVVACFEGLLREMQADVRHQGVAEQHVRRVQEYIRRHYDEELSVGALAQEAGLSQSYLGKIFTVRTGQYITDFIAACRVERACELLKNTNDTVVSISVQVGIADHHYFSKLFKKKMGFGPMEYRRQLKKTIS